MERIAQQVHQVRLRQRTDHETLHLHAGRLQRTDHPHERMSGINLVVAVRADEEQVPYVSAGQQRLQHAERRRICPLQIVEEHHQRVILLCERAEEVLEDELEAV